MRYNEFEILKEWDFAAANPIPWVNDNFIVKIQRIRYLKKKKNNIRYKVCAFKAYTPTYFMWSVYIFNDVMKKFWRELWDLINSLIRKERLDDFGEVLDD